MKKNKKITGAFLFFLLLFPAFIFGQGVTIINPLGDASIASLVDNIISYLQQIAFIIAPIMLIVAGFMYYFAGGKPEQAKKAADIIKWTVVGLAIVIIANGIASIVAGIMGVSIEETQNIINSFWS